MVFSALVLVAALKMKRLQAYWLAVVASLLAVIISPSNLIGLPIGIWALVVLSQREVRAAFGRVRATGSALGGTSGLSTSESGAGSQAAPAIQEEVADDAAIADARRQVHGPAFGLLLTGVINVVVAFAIPLIDVSLYSSSPLGPHAPQSSAGIGFAMAHAAILCFICYGLIIFAAFKMQRLRAYPLAIVASVLAILSPALLIGLPIGIWALVVLSQREVRAAFQRVRANGSRVAADLSPRAAGVAASREYRPKTGYRGPHSLRRGSCARPVCQRVSEWGGGVWARRRADPAGRFYLHRTPRARVRNRRPAIGRRESRRDHLDACIADHRSAAGLRRARVYRDFAGWPSVARLLPQSLTKPAGPVLLYEVDSPTTLTETFKAAAAAKRRVGEGGEKLADVIPVCQDPTDRRIAVTLYGRSDKDQQRVERLLAGLGNLEFRVLADSRRDRAIVEQARKEPEKNEVLDPSGKKLAWWRR